MFLCVHGTFLVIQGSMGFFAKIYELDLTQLTFPTLQPNAMKCPRCRGGIAKKCIILDYEIHEFLP